MLLGNRSHIPIFWDLLVIFTTKMRHPDSIMTHFICAGHHAAEQ
jgi:hypothetical protein